ncbi:MAG: polysaccharide biosynthesis tyrosine autokinase [Pirellulales bacterium]
MLPPNAGDASYSNGTSSPPQNGNGHGQGDLVPIGSAGGQLSLPGLYGWSGAMPMRPELLTARPDPISLARALRRRWALGAVLGSVMGLTAAVLAWFFLPLGYEVAAWVQVDRTPPSVMGQQGYIDPKESDAFRQNQAVLVKSDLVLLQALRKHNNRLRNLPLIRERPDKVKWLQSNLRVGYSGESDVMSISMRDDYPNQMIEIVNTVTETYLEEVVDKQRNQKVNEINTLKTQLNQTLKAIQADKDSLNQLTKSGGTAEPEAAAAREQIALHHLASLQTSKNMIDESLRRAKSKLRTLAIQKRLALDPAKRQSIIESYIDEDPWVSSMNRDLMEAQRDASRMSKNLVPGKKSSAGTAMMYSLNSLKREIDQLKQQLRPGVEKKFDLQTVDAINAELQVATADARALQAELDDLTERYDEQAEEVQNIRTYNSEIEAIRARIEPQEKLADELSQKISARDLDLKLPSRIKKIQLAEAPEGYSNKTRYALVSFFAVCAFGLTVAGFAYREFLDRRVLSASQVAEGLGVRVMGSLPDLSNKARKRLAGRSGDGAALISGLMSESIDSVRTMLLHGVRSKNTQVILVTSAMEQEGKSTVASQLAASLARCGKRTLLVDGDLRRPAAHLLFDMSNEAGLSEVLRGESELEEVVQPTQAPDLWLLPAGQCDLQAVQSLAASKAREVCEKLRARFDFIIVDSGPVLAYADTMLLGQIVDAAILSVLRDVSRTPKVYEAFEKLASVNVEVLGAVVGGEATFNSRRRLPMAVKN